MLGIIGFIIINFIADSLDGRILCGIDLQTAAVYQIVGLCLVIAFLRHKNFGYLINRGIYKIGIDGFGLSFFVDRLDAGINIILGCHVVFGLRDIALLEHVFQNFLPSFRIVLRM